MIDRSWGAGQACRIGKFLSETTQDAPDERKSTLDTPESNLARPGAENGQFDLDGLVDGHDRP